MTDEWISHMTPAEFIDRMRRDRAAFAALWDNLTDAQMTARPCPQGDWSVKDLIAHITAWETWGMDRARDALNGIALTSTTEAEIDSFNAQVWQRHANTPLDAVLNAFDANLTRLEGFIDNLSEDDLNRTVPWGDEDGSVLYLLIGNTFGHLNDHRDDLVAYVQQVTVG